MMEERREADNKYVSLALTEKTPGLVWCNLLVQPGQAGQGLGRYFYSYPT